MKRRQLYSFAFAALFLFTVSSCKKSTNEHSEDHGVNDMTGEAVPITNSDVEIPDTSSVAMFIMYVLWLVKAKRSTTKMYLALCVKWN